MLTDAPAYTILTADDLSRAEKFYSEVLGLEKVNLGAQGIVCFGKAPWVRLVLYEKKGFAAGEVSHLSFDVKDIENLVKELEGKGVKFEDYPEAGTDPETHIASHGNIKSAWFKDSEGNLVGLNEVS